VVHFRCHLIQNDMSDENLETCSFKKLVASWPEIVKCFKEKNSKQMLEILEKCQTKEKLQTKKIKYF